MFNNGGIVPVANMNGGDNGGFGNNGLWVLIILFAIFGGFGRGFGGGGNGNCCNPCCDNGVQRGFDNQNVINKLNGLENGICDLGYDQLKQMNTMNTTFLQQGFAQQTATMQGFNNAQAQLAQCCCDIREGISGLRYDMAAGNCATNTAIAQAAQNIMQNDNANYRQLHDELFAFQREQDKQKIHEQELELNNYRYAMGWWNCNHGRCDCGQCC